MRRELRKGIFNIDSTSECVEYREEDVIYLKINKCPCCGLSHEFELKFEPITVFYFAISPEAYKLEEKFYVLKCPKTGTHFKICIRVHYPYHFSKMISYENR